VYFTSKVAFNIFNKSDLQFSDLHNTLDVVCVDLRKKGVGAEVHHAAVISLEHKEFCFGALVCLELTHNCRYFVQPFIWLDWTFAYAEGRNIGICELSS